MPRASPLAKCEFATIRERLIKIGARHRAHRSHPRLTANQLPGRNAIQVRRARPHAIRSISGGAMRPDKPLIRQINPERVASRVASHRSRRTERRRASTHQTAKKIAWCIVRVRSAGTKPTQPLTPRAAVLFLVRRREILMQIDGGLINVCIA